MLNLGACTALGEIGRNCPLPVPDSGDKDKQPTKKSVIDRLVSTVQTIKSNVSIKVIIVHNKSRKFSWRNFLKEMKN